MLNDGLAVTLFIFFKGIISNGTSGNILMILAKEIIGAIFVGFVISFIMHKLLKQSNNPIMHILISLLDVSLCYVICETFGFSGVIASVVCGMYFAHQDKKIVRWKEVVDPKELYSDFWNIIESLLNSVLFVLVGFSVLSIEINKIIFLLIPIAIILNLIARYVGVRVSTMLMREKNIPSKLSKKDFSKLLTWSGLKGGLSLALALTTKGLLASSDFTIVINMILITILFTTIVQGLIIGKVYKNIEKKREEKSLRVI